MPFCQTLVLGCVKIVHGGVCKTLGMFFKLGFWDMSKWRGMHLHFIQIFNNRHTII